MAESSDSIMFSTRSIVDLNSGRSESKSRLTSLLPEKGQSKVEKTILLAYLFLLSLLLLLLLPFAHSAILFIELASYFRRRRRLLLFVHKRNLVYGKIFLHDIYFPLLCYLLLFAIFIYFRCVNIEIVTVDVNHRPPLPTLFVLVERVYE